ncbi:MAG TPA: 50S ribosomal protein L11 methyltransferase [Methylomirabilota bacterium]|nr:50S ribosomal protein L11 methyltransferase [Methylomirabilota bacterium]
MAVKKAKTLWHFAITTSVEAEEAVAELLTRTFGQSPVVYTNQDTGLTIASNYLQMPRANLTKLEREIAAEFSKLRSFGLQAGSGEIQIKPVKREDWAESWKKYFKTIQIGLKLLIKPSWSRRVPKPGQQVVVLDPGLSFGTGQHATTSFCLKETVRSRKPGTKQSFLDVGCGSGILAISAAKLGYSPVEAFDFDPVAVRVARANARRNRVENKLTLGQRDLTKIPAKPKAAFDVVCANLIYDLLIAEADRITARVKPGGLLVLAGILSTQFEQTIEPFLKRGFKLLRTKVEREWQSGALRRQ